MFACSKVAETTHLAGVRIKTSKIIPSCILLTVLFLIGNVVCQHEFFNLGFTPHRLTERHFMEELMVDFSKNRLNFLKAEKQNLIKVLQQRKSTSSQLFTRLLSWRYSMLVNHLYIMFSYDLSEEVKKIMVDVKWPALKPSAEDEVGSHEMYITLKLWFYLQQVVMLKPSNLSTGLTLDTNAGGKLTTLQELEIATYHLYDNKYYMAIEWLEQALIQNAHASLTESKKCSLDLLNSLYKVCVQWHNKQRNNSYSNIDPSKPTHLLDLDQIEFFASPVTQSSLVKFPYHQTNPVRQTNREIYHQKYKGSELGRKDEKTTLHAQFMEGCLGNKQMPLAEQATLYCYLDNRRNPYFYINPLYVEVLSLKREVYQYHQVIGSQTIKRLMKIRQRDLYRNGFTCGLTNENYPLCKPGKHTPPVFKYTELILGLKNTYCNGQCQFLEYMPGRHSREHNDHTGDQFSEEKAMEQLEEFGDYLATFIYYLETPEIGGETYFLPAGNYAEASKGSAVFWWGMYRNGSLRFNETEHGSCPVVHGRKIVHTEFIRYNTNWQTLPCSLNQLE